MKTLMLAVLFLSLPALADTFTVIKSIDGEAPVIDSAEESAEDVQNRATDYNSSRSNKQGVRLDEDSDDDGPELRKRR